MACFSNGLTTDFTLFVSENIYNYSTLSSWMGYARNGGAVRLVATVMDGCTFYKLEEARRKTLLNGILSRYLTAEETRSQIIQHIMDNHSVYQKSA